jgi:hypothetical protein
VLLKNMLLFSWLSWRLPTYASHRGFSDFL